MRDKWPYRPVLIFSFCSMNQLAVFIFPLEWTVHRKVIIFIFNLLIPIYTPGWRVTQTARGTCVAKKHDTMSLVKAGIWTAWSRGQHINHEVTSPPQRNHSLNTHHSCLKNLWWLDQNTDHTLGVEVVVRPMAYSSDFFNSLLGLKRERKHDLIEKDKLSFQ